MDYGKKKYIEYAEKDAELAIEYMSSSLTVGHTVAFDVADAIENALSWDQDQDFDEVY